MSMKSWVRSVSVLLVLSAPGLVFAQAAEGKRLGAIPVDYPPQEVLKAVEGQLAIGIDPYRLKDAWKRPTSMISYELRGHSSRCL